MVPNEMYTVAWFKLADFVTRGEKERALGVHRLLMHSVTDKALSFQLEADILLAFDDFDAIDKYHIAANLYKKSGRYKQAIAVYEHVVTFKPEPTIIEALLDVYLIEHKFSLLLDMFERFAYIHVGNGNIGIVINKLHLLGTQSSPLLLGRLYARFSHVLLSYDHFAMSALPYIQQTILYFQDAPNASKEEIEYFLEKIARAQPHMYEKALAYYQVR